MSLSQKAGHVKDIIISPIKEIIGDSRAVGIVLISCTLVSLIISNSVSGNKYVNFWEIPIPLLEHLQLPGTFLHIINDALMAAFFLLAGAEIKRELLVGELAGIKKALLPILAALGGMMVPAIIYSVNCMGTPYQRGWGIPMATDIAFSLGVLSLLGKKAPLPVRIFLTALAIIDDLGGILTIAVFYAESLNLIYLGLAVATLAALITMNLKKVQQYKYYIILGIPLWYFLYNSGIHATISGVLLAFTLPLHKINELLHKLHDPVSFIILPLFALANTAIIVPGDVGSIVSSKVFYGIFAGLVVGKPLGIFLFSYTAIKLKLATLPEQMTMRQLLGMGVIAGIGFTMSIFMTGLAFSDPVTQTIGKVTIIMAAVISGSAGFLLFWFAKNKTIAAT